MKIRKAAVKDLPGIIRIYDEIHTREETGEVTIGWLRGIYPKKTARKAGRKAKDTAEKAAEALKDTA